MRRVIFCSGKVFYHLYHARQAAGIRDITLVRLEQIAPFPFDLVAPVLQLYKNAQVVWVQEEPKNMGAWSYVKPRFDTAMRSMGVGLDPAAQLRDPIRYVGRTPSAASATGAYRLHAIEQKALVDRALSLKL